MDGIGEKLRKRREELGLTIDDVAETTKFRPEIIKAIEAGRWGVFGAGVYQDAFLTTYARALGLDAKLLVRDQKGEEERAQEAIRLIGSRPKGRSISGRKLTAVVAITATVIVAALVLSDYLGERNVSREKTARSTDSLKTESPEAMAGKRLRRKMIPVAVDTASVASRVQKPDSARGQEVQPASPMVTAKVDTVRKRLASSGEVAGATGTGGVDTVSASPGDATTGKALPNEAVTGAQPGVATLEITARAGAQLKLTSGGRVLFDGYLTGGDRRVFRSAAPFVIVSLSDRGAVAFSLDGRVVVLPESGAREIFDLELPSNPRVR